MGPTSGLGNFFKPQEWPKKKKKKKEKEKEDKGEQIAASVQVGDSFSL